MPNRYEALPPTRPNLQFPGGDAGEEYAARALEVISELRLGDHKEQLTGLRVLRLIELNSWRAISKNEESYRGLNFLAGAWADAFVPDSTAAKAIAHSGVFQTVGLAKRTGLFPVGFADFRDEIVSMISYDADVISLLGSEAWDCMAGSHPNIHRVMTAWHSFLQEFSRLDEQSQLSPLLAAAVALPYVLSAATRMDGYQKINTDAQLEKLISSQD